MKLDTLAARATHSLEVRNSRFLAIAAPVDSVAAALAFIDEVRVAAATHNCWAYRLGDQYRSSDDGEPSGTAGRPILAAIDGQGFDGVAVVVTRWYGGVKLGAGGLVRAYGGCAAECLRTAPRLPRSTTVRCELAIDFNDIGAAHVALAACSATKLSERFDEHGAHLCIELPADRVEALRSQLRDATRDRSRCITRP